MPYTKGEMISQVMDRVQNQVNLDNATRKVYVQKYLSAAINYANTDQYYFQQKTSEPEGLREFDNQFVGAMQKTDVLWDSEREQHYIIIPGKRATYIHGKDIIFIGPSANQRNSYKPIQQNQYSATARSLGLSSARYYMLEQYNYAWLINHPSTIIYLWVKKIWSVDEMEDDDVLPLTADQEVKVMEMIVEFFLGKRKLPEDTVTDNKDIKQN